MTKHRFKKTSIASRWLYRVLVLNLFLIIPVYVYADCDGEMRQVTTDEKALFDWADKVFPALIRTDDYLLDDTHRGSSEKFRCVNTPNEPYHLSMSFRLSPQGNAAEAVKAGAADMAAQMQEMMADLKQMQQRGASMEEMLARSESQRQSIEQQNNKIRAQSGIKLKAYFNGESARCRGTAISIPHAFVACRDMNKSVANLEVLLGHWAESAEKQGDYNAVFDASAPMSRLQTVNLVVVADPKALDTLITATDWAAIADKIGE